MSEGPFDSAAGEVIAMLAGLIEQGCEGDGVAQKRAVLDGTATLLDADAWVWTLTRTPAPGDRQSMPVVVLRLDGGLSDAQRDVLLLSQRSPHRSIFVEALFREVFTQGRATRRRDELLDDGAWRGSPYHAEFVGPLGLDEFAIAVRRIAAGDVSTAVFYRAAGRPAFDAGASRILDGVMDHVGWLHRHGPIEDLAAHATSLTPRARQVLQLLIAGEGRKQIAAKLGIGEHTVGDYLKQIYRRFGVASRGELQAKFFAGQSSR